MKQNICITMAFCLLVTACGTTVKTGPLPGGITKEVITPQTTNLEITDSNGDYYVFSPGDEKAEARLMIFLPGSLVKPRIYQQILRTGAENGVYSVGLSYQNKFTLTGQCRGEGRDCEGNLSREELEGRDYSDKVEVNRARSFEGRILALVKYMQQQQPDENWDTFVSDGAIQWDKIIIAGHSQGSSHAAYIGWHRPVARVGMFSGPHNVANEQGPQVNWLQDQRETAASRFYGFGNTKDSVTDFSLQKAAWSAMGLARPVSLVDETDAPYRSSHQLSTSVGDDSALNGAHGSTCVDMQSPQNDQGEPAFKPVWLYMLFR